MAHLLIVDDDANTLASLARAFRLAGHEATVCDNAARAMELVKSQHFDLIFSDVVMPGKDGLALLEDFKTLGIPTPVVMISGQANIDMAVRATRLGAVDFLEKPLTTDKLLLTIENILKLKRLEEENRQLRQRVGKHEIIWKSEAMRRVMAQVERVAASETRVCILGETGTGKELIESELFGHEKGAFTGAAQRHVGKFEQAQHGTLFLDEIGDMPPVMQTKLLRVLEESEIERVGGDRPVTVNVRVVVATHRNLEDLVKRGTFRQDLYHRIFVFPISLPPLRERLEDIPVLVEHFARQIADQNGWKTQTFAPEALAALKRYSWPGNVRELRNIVERLLLLSGEQVDAATVEATLPHQAVAAGGSSSMPANGSLAERVDAFEREVLLAELKHHSYRMTETAKVLGLERSHLYKKCQALGIDLQAVKKGESDN